MAMKNEISRLVGANMLLEKSRETAPEGMKRWSRSENKERLWLWQVMEIKSDAVKDNTLQQSQVGRSMTQGKSEVVKQEMGRVNFYILGVSGLKQTGMGAFFFLIDFHLRIFSLQNLTIFCQTSTWIRHEDPNSSDDHSIYYDAQEKILHLHGEIRCSCLNSLYVIYRSLAEYITS